MNILDISLIFSIQPEEYTEMYKSKHENKILTIDNIGDITIYANKKGNSCKSSLSSNLLC